MEADRKGSLVATRTLGETQGFENASPVVSVVLPCLDEAQAVGACVSEAMTTLHDLALTAEVIVVDNGSTDESASVARRAGARVVHEERRGYGQALRTGIDAARGEVVVMADADGSYPLDRVGDLVEPVLAGDADLVIGGRLNGATRRTMPILHRRVGTPLLSFLVRRATGGIRLTDSQSGFRAFRRADVADLPISGTGMEFASEMLLLGARAGWRIEEIPTGYRERVGRSKLSPLRDGMRHLRFLTHGAPDLILVLPGAFVAAVGVLLAVVGLLRPDGIDVAGFTWRPVFLSTIAIVIGTQAMLAGVVLAHYRSVTEAHARVRFPWVGAPAFSRWCIRGGLLGVLAGLAVNVVLFIVWVSDQQPANALSLASIAQTLMILGTTAALFGVVYRLVGPPQRRLPPGTQPDA